MAKHAHMINEQSAKRSALKGQPVQSTGRCPGSGLVGLSARAGPQTSFFPHNLHQFNISILNTLPLGLDAYRNVFREIDMFGEESASREEL